jgi:hypothetical protein
VDVDVVGDPSEHGVSDGSASAAGLEALAEHRPVVDICRIGVR